MTPEPLNPQATVFWPMPTEAEEPFKSGLGPTWGFLLDWTQASRSTYWLQDLRVSAPGAHSTAVVPQLHPPFIEPPHVYRQNPLHAHLSLLLPSTPHICTHTGLRSRLVPIPMPHGVSGREITGSQPPPTLTGSQGFLSPTQLLRDPRLNFHLQPWLMLWPSRSPPYSPGSTES